jgi:hypothetical protein
MKKKMGNFQPTSLAVNSSTSAPPPRCSAASPQPPLTPPGVRFFYYVLRSLVTQPPISPSALPSPAVLPPCQVSFAPAVAAGPAREVFDELPACPRQPRARLFYGTSIPGVCLTNPC